MAPQQKRLGQSTNYEIVIFNLREESKGAPDELKIYKIEKLTIYVIKTKI